jgi:rod shape-determining protein MreD
MMDSVILRAWMYRGIFVLCAIALAFARLLPVSALPLGWPGPDVMVSLAFAWVLRRPEYVPVLLIAAVFLAADLLFQRPPGLWTAVVVMGSEVLRRRAHSSVELPLLAEWALFTGTLFAITVAYQGALWLTMSETVRAGLVGIGFAQTVLLYPLVVFLCHFVFGVRRAMPGSVERLGRAI